MFLTIKFFLADLRFLLQKKPHDFLGGKARKTSTKIRLLAQVLVSLAVLILGFILMLDHTQDKDTKQFGAGFIGTVVGYWLR